MKNMIENTILDFLNTNLDVPVYMERPETPPDEYILLEKTSATSENHIYTATIAAQSYAKTLYEAATLNDVLKATMQGAVELSQITRVSLNSDYNFTNTANKQYRYQAVFVVTHYEDY